MDLIGVSPLKFCSKLRFVLGEGGGGEDPFYSARAGVFEMPPVRWLPAVVVVGGKMKISAHKQFPG